MVHGTCVCRAEIPPALFLRVMLNAVVQCRVATLAEIYSIIYEHYFWGTINSLLDIIEKKNIALSQIHLEHQRRVSRSFFTISPALVVSASGIK